MNPDEDKEGSKVFRKGRPVIKTTVEFDDDIYSEIKIKAMETHKTMKEFLTEAAVEKIKKAGMDPAKFLAIDHEFNANPFARKVLELLTNEMPVSLAKIVLAQKCNLKGIRIRELSPEVLDEEFIEILKRAIAHLSGEDEASGFEDELRQIAITRGVR